MGPSPQLLLPTKPPEFSAFNAIFASFVAGLGAFVFGYSLGFTSPGNEEHSTTEEPDGGGGCQSMVNRWLMILLFSWASFLGLFLTTIMRVPVMLFLVVAFVFYSLSLSLSTVLTAMEILKDDTVFKDSTLEQVVLGDFDLTCDLTSICLFYM